MTHKNVAVYLGGMRKWLGPTQNPRTSFQLCTHTHTHTRVACRNCTTEYILELHLFALKDWNKYMRPINSILQKQNGCYQNMHVIFGMIQKFKRKKKNVCLSNRTMLFCTNILIYNSLPRTTNKISSISKFLDEFRHGASVWYESA